MSEALSKFQEPAFRAARRTPGTLTGTDERGRPFVEWRPVNVVEVDEPTLWQRIARWFRRSA